MKEILNIIIWVILPILLGFLLYAFTNNQFWLFLIIFGMANAVCDVYNHTKKIK